MATRKKAAVKSRSTSPRTKPAAKKSTKPATRKKTAAITKTATKKTASRTDKKKDPRGGLTQAGREYFARTEGAHLKPGVKGPADTPEKRKRKGSFLRRHFANPRGPMEKDGRPTRLALSAQAWGEPLPTTAEDARKLAAKGKRLLQRYDADKERTPGKSAGK